MNRGRPLVWLGDEWWGCIGYLYLTTYSLHRPMRDSCIPGQNRNSCILFANSMHRKLDLRNKSGGGGQDHVAPVNFTREEGVGTSEFFFPPLPPPASLHEPWETTGINGRWLVRVHWVPVLDHVLLHRSMRDSPIPMRVLVKIENHAYFLPILCIENLTWETKVEEGVGPRSSR